MHVAWMLQGCYKLLVDSFTCYTRDTNWDRANFSILWGVCGDSRTPCCSLHSKALGQSSFLSTNWVSRISSKLVTVAIRASEYLTQDKVVSTPSNSLGSITVVGSNGLRPSLTLVKFTITTACSSESGLVITTQICLFDVLGTSI